MYFLIWPCNLVFDPKWPKFELILDFIKTKILLKFQVSSAGNVASRVSIDTHLDSQQQTAFENIVGNGEIARKEQFPLFPQCFLLNQIIAFSFVSIFNIISLFPAEFEEPKIDISGKG